MWPFDEPTFGWAYSKFIFTVAGPLGLQQGAQGQPFIPHDMSTWLLPHYLLFLAPILTGSLAIDALCSFIFGHILRLPLIPNTGKHYDRLTVKDYLYVLYNMVVGTAGWMYFVNVVENTSDGVIHGDWKDLTLLNSLVPTVLFFICHDLWWAPVHRLFHSHPTLYKAFHKFHHKQLAPSRGLKDALFNSPPEATIGLFVHCWAVWVVPRYLCPIHLYALRFLVPLAEIQAYVQHCRFDLRSPIGDAFFDSWKHDMHHWDPSCNYGTYTNVIDRLMGTLKQPKYDLEWKKKKNEGERRVPSSQ